MHSKARVRQFCVDLRNNDYRRKKHSSIRSAIRTPSPSRQNERKRCECNNLLFSGTVLSTNGSAILQSHIRSSARRELKQVCADLRNSLNRDVKNDAEYGNAFPGYW